MKTHFLIPAILVWVFTIPSFGQNEQIPNGGFETWHSQGQGEDPDTWGSLFNQFDQNPNMVTKTTDANSGNYALKLACDTGSVFWIPGDTIYGSVNLGLVNAQVSNAKVPFNSKPDSLTGYMKGTVINGGFYMNMKLYKAGASIASATYFFVASSPGYSGFSVPVTYSQNVTPDTMTFTIIAAHPGLNPSADPNNECYVDDLVLIYNTTGISDAESNVELSIFPNPVSNLLQIENKTSETLFLNVFEITGKNLLIAELQPGKNTISITEFSDGIYFYQVINLTGKILKTEKLVKR